MAPFPSFPLWTPDIFPQGNTCEIVIETILHYRNGRRRLIDGALVSGGRHINDIFHFLSIPEHIPPPPMPWAEPTFSHTQLPEGKLGDTKLTRVTQAA